MASIPSEVWNSVLHEDEFDRMEVSQIDTALLMDFLEESHGEEDEDVRLGSIIQSLEAEVNPNMHGSLFDPDFDSNDDGRSGSSSSHIHNSFNWIDMEMSPSSPSYDMGIYYLDSFMNEDVDIIDFEDLRVYSQFDYGTPFDDNTYGSLWQETYEHVHAPLVQQALWDTMNL